MQTFHIVQRKQVKILWLESLIVALFVGFTLKTSFKLDNIIVVAAVTAVYLGCVFLFFMNRWFRYIFSLLASYLWANITWHYLLHHSTGNTPIIVAVIVFIVVTAWHVEHFNFMKDARLRH